MMAVVLLWRLVALLAEALLVAVASVVIARRRHQCGVLGMAALSWAVGVWAALTVVAALL